MNTYFDYNAGAPLRPAAAAAMAEVIDRLRFGGNPSSQHQQGRILRSMIDSARDSVAEIAGATADEVVFTSCATESAATVLSAPWDEVLFSGLEHACVRNGIRSRGRVVPVHRDGRLDLSALRNILEQGIGRRLVAVTAANHETGVVQPVAEAAAIAHEHGAAVYCDASQVLGRTDFRFGRLGIAYAGVSSSKIGGPAGIGALLVRPDTALPPLLTGGGQESRRRAGTENCVGIAGFGAAAVSIAREDWGPAERLRDRLERRLREEVPLARIFGIGAPRLPNVSCLGLPGWHAGPLVIALDLEGFSVGAGSACSSGAFEPAQSLLAMDPEAGMPNASAAIRVSLGPDTGGQELDGLLDALIRLAHRRIRLAA